VDRVDRSEPANGSKLLASRCMIQTIQTIQTISKV